MHETAQSARTMIVYIFFISIPPFLESVTDTEFTSEICCSKRGFSKCKDFSSDSKTYRRQLKCRVNLKIFVILAKSQSNADSAVESYILGIGPIESCMRHDC